MADKEKAETEEEYESDLDDAPLPAVRRRAAASDDEEEEEEEEEAEDGGKPSPRMKAGSDAESDGQGAAEVYDEDDEEYEEYEEVYEDFEEGRGGEGGVATETVVAAGDGDGMKGEAEAQEEAVTAGEEEGKKGSEPYAVPTTGAFYMHDDRFQEARGRGRQRRMLSNRKVWTPKEEQEWVHDRFDEMNPHYFHNDNARNPRGRFRGRGGRLGGRTRGVTRGNFRGNRPRTHYHDGNKNYSYVPKESHIYHDNTKNARWVPFDNGKNKAPKPSHAHYDDVNNFGVVPKESHTNYDDARSHKNRPSVIRGRGSRRYQPHWRSTTEISSEQNNKSQSPENDSSNGNFGKHPSQISNYRPELGFPIKKTFASNLNSASPPFYPSRSSHREPPVSQRGHAQPSTSSRPFSSPIGTEHVSPTSQYAPLLTGKAFVPSVGHGKLHVGAAMKGMHNPASPSSASSSNGPFPVATNQIIRDSFQSPHPVVQQRPLQSSSQSMPRMPAQMFGARLSSSDKMSSSIQPTCTVLTEDTEICSPHGSNKAITRLMVKGQHDDQDEEHASFLYGGAHVLGATGAMGLTLGDQGFRGAPTIWPVMQFRGQHPGGRGVPSIGMALPGFVSQQQLGLSNSEMAWLPILSGASGALGATYGSPYMPMDGSYYSQLSEQAPSSVSPREPSSSHAPSQLRSPEITEVGNDELSQRQNKPRRYSEMNFGQ